MREYVCSVKDCNTVAIVNSNADSVTVKCTKCGKPTSYVPANKRKVVLAPSINQTAPSETQPPKIQTAAGKLVDIPKPA